MFPIRRLQHFLALLAGTTRTSAQTFIVDQIGGPGSHFTDLPPAVVAVPDGATLRVRPGTYSPFSVVGKGLSIVGDQRATVVVDGTLGVTSLRQTSPQQEIVLSGMTFASSDRALEVRNTLGNTLIHDIETVGSRPYFPIRDTSLRIVDSPRVILDQFVQGLGIVGCTRTPPPALLIERSNVHITHSSLLGLSGCTAISLSPSYFLGGDALTAIDSRLFIVATQITGGSGGTYICSAPAYCSEGHQGGRGVRLTRSILLATGAASSIRGGDGPSGFRASGGNGGDGLELVSSSSAILEGFNPQGGAGGSPGGTPGQPWSADLSSSVGIDATQRSPAARLVGTPAVGSLVSFALDATPNSLAYLWFSYSAVFAYSPPLLQGPLLALPEVVVGPISVPVTGTVGVRFPLPQGWPLDDAIVSQYLVAQPGDAFVRVSNVMITLVKS